jgi:hypothetical protein
MKIKYLSKIIFAITTCLFILLIVQTGVSQPPPPLLPNDVTQAPIDTGLFGLGMMGLMYAIKKIRTDFKNQSNKHS